MNGKLLLSVDIGSTYTKGALFLLEGEELRLLGRKVRPTTVDDLGRGFADVRAAALAGRPDGAAGDVPVYWSSSARGGLKIAAVGLTPDLTLSVARMAATSAGGKVVRAFSYELASDDLAELEAVAPDIVLLTGGTDGGNSRVVLHNAARLAETSLPAVILYAGNRKVRDRVAEILAGQRPRDGRERHARGRDDRHRARPRGHPPGLPRAHRRGQRPRRRRRGDRARAPADAARRLRARPDDRGAPARLGGLRPYRHGRGDHRLLLFHGVVPRRRLDPAARTPRAQAEAYGRGRPGPPGFGRGPLQVREGVLRIPTGPGRGGARRAPTNTLRRSAARRNTCPGTTGAAASTSFWPPPASGPPLSVMAASSSASSRRRAASTSSAARTSAGSTASSARAATWPA